MASHNIESNLHYLPCGIKFDGPVPVESYFKPILSSSAPNTLESSFRGRKLIGKEVILPNNVTGITVQTNSSSQLDITGVFSNVVVWEHDKKPSDTVMEEPLQWFDVANQVNYCFCFYNCLLFFTVLLSYITFFYLDSLHLNADIMHFH
jgi:ribonuclease H2 subunit C